MKPRSFLTEELARARGTDASAIPGDDLERLAELHRKDIGAFYALPADVRQAVADHEARHSAGADDAA